jgi:adenylate cyclase
MDKYINLLIVDKNQKTQNGLRGILSEKGANILISESYEDAIKTISKKKIGILFLDIDSDSFEGDLFFKKIKENSKIENTYIISITDNQYKGIKSVKGLKEGAIDYITKPLTPSLIKAKIDVYKDLYFKEIRINQLLQNIFPENVLIDLNEQGKFLPKRIENGVVLFTDFIHFSQIAKEIKPMELLKKLEHYFNFFEDIVEQYKLEKIKTIGDSYMVIGGVNEKIKNPAIRACLAAIEIKNFMIKEKLIAQATKQDFWEIRIGIHTGPLVAGIIGSKKISFDVWGDTVNIASRAEQSSEKNEITITQSIVDQIGDYFEIKERGDIDIKKRGGSIQMYFLNKLRPKYSLFNEGMIPNTMIRTLCDLPNVDLDNMRIDILNKLKTLLPEEVIYHNIEHTINVEKTALLLGEIEGINEEEKVILQTAILYHDSGFILDHEDNEKHAIQLAINNLPKYGYSDKQIKEITDIISITKRDAGKPKSLLQKIMLDADHDYLGRDDYFSIAEKLRIELENYDNIMTDTEWIIFQLNYLEDNHRFYTETAKNLRLHTKKDNIYLLKKKLNN